MSNNNRLFLRLIPGSRFFVLPFSSFLYSLLFVLRWLWTRTTAGVPNPHAALPDPYNSPNPNPTPNSNPNRNPTLTGLTRAGLLSLIIVDA